MAVKKVMAETLINRLEGEKELSQEKIKFRFGQRSFLAKNGLS